MDDSTRNALRTIADAHRALATALDSLLDDVAPRAARSIDRSQAPADSEHPVVWDPELNSPLLPPTPEKSAPRAQQDWCSLAYLGGIYAINKRYNRGATPTEVRDYAIKAGYQDGRAVTAWSKGKGSTQNDEAKQRWINADGVGYVKKLSAELGVSLPPDLAESWVAPDFS